MWSKPLSPLGNNHRFFFFILIIVTVLGPAGIDFYLPAFPALMAEFSAEAATIQATLSSFLAGFVVGMLVLGPVSDRMGRRPVLIAGTVVFVISAIVCSLAPTIGVLLVARFFLGVGACAGQVIARAMISDRHDRTESSRMLSMVWMIVAGGPLVFPLIGGWILTVADWRMIFHILTISGALTLLVLVIAMPETLPPGQRHPHTVKNIAHSFKRLLGNSVYMGYAGSATAVMAGFFIYLGSAPAVFMHYYDISLQHFGLFFGTIVSGFMIGSFLNSRLVRRYGSDPMLQFGLYAALAAGLVVNLAAWSGIGGVYFFTFGMALFTASASFIGGNAMAGGLAQFPKIAGLASGLMGIMQFTCGGIGVWFAGIAFDYDPTSRPLAVLMLVVIMVGIVLHRFLVREPAGTA